MKNANSRGEGIWLQEDELAFYDALTQNDSALSMGDDTLRHIARDLVESVPPTPLVNVDYLRFKITDLSKIFAV